MTPVSVGTTLNVTLNDAALLPLGWAVRAYVPAELKVAVIEELVALIVGADAPVGTAATLHTSPAIVVIGLPNWLTNDDAVNCWLVFVQVIALVVVPPGTCATVMGIDCETPFWYGSVCVTSRTYFPAAAKVTLVVQPLPLNWGAVRLPARSSRSSSPWKPAQSGCGTGPGTG